MNKKEKLLFEAIIAFEKQTNKLVELLADEYELNLDFEHPFGKLITRTNNLWNGCMNYQFH